MRKPYQSPGQDEKLLYWPGRGLNSRPPAHRSFKHALNHSAKEVTNREKTRTGYIEIHPNEKMPVFRPRSESSKITNKTVYGGKSGRTTQEGKTRKTLDWGSAGIDGNGPGRVQKQMYVGENIRRCPSRGGD